MWLTPGVTWTSTAKLVRWFEMHKTEESTISSVIPSELHWLYVKSIFLKKTQVMCMLELVQQIYENLHQVRFRLFIPNQLLSTYSSFGSLTSWLSPFCSASVIYVINEPGFYFFTTLCTYCANQIRWGLRTSGRQKESNKKVKCDSCHESKILVRAKHMQRATIHSN